MKRIRRCVVLAVAASLVLPAMAFASSAVSAPTLVLPWQQVWPIVIGGLVPLVTYGLNYVGPWLSEPAKAAVLVAVTTVATALYTAIETNVFGFNTATLQLLLTGIAGALGAHHLLWKPSAVAWKLGAGRNRQWPPKAPATVTGSATIHGNTITQDPARYRSAPGPSPPPAPPPPATPPPADPPARA